MYKNIIIGVFAVCFVFAIIGWNHQINVTKKINISHGDTLIALGATINKWKESLDLLEKVSDEYMETGNKLNECIFNNQ